MTEVHEGAIVRSAFNFSTAIYVPARAMRRAVASPANMTDDVVHAERLDDMVHRERQGPASDPWQPAAGLGAQRDASPYDHAVGRDQQDSAESHEHDGVRSRHRHDFAFRWCACR